MASTSRERRRRRGIALAVSAAPAAALLAAAAPASAGSRSPSISFSGDPSAGGVVDWTVNRRSKAIARVHCTLGGDSFSCGTLQTGGVSAGLRTSKSTTYAVSLPTFLPLTTYVVKVTLTDHERVSGSETVGSEINFSALFVASSSSIFPSGANM
jgi:hypothetical protein